MLPVFQAPNSTPLLSQELPFVIFQVPLPCGFFTLITPQTCGTHAMIDVKLRSLVLIRMSQRNLLWSYSQHWGGCHRSLPPLPRHWNASPPTPSGALLNHNVNLLSHVILLSYSKWLLLQTSDFTNLIMSFPGEQLFPVSSLFDSQINDKIPWANITIVPVFPHLTCILSWLNRWALPSYLSGYTDISQQVSVKTSTLTLQQLHNLPATGVRYQTNPDIQHKQGKGGEGGRRVVGE